MSIDVSGICGIVGSFTRKDDLEKMGNGMRVAKHAHNREIYIDDSVGFLSLSSRNNGCKVVKNEKGTIVAIINGEISNAAEIKRQLESKGHVFSSHVDHEVLVHLFENLNTDPLAFQSIRGAFSFAIWDSTSKKLMLGLDKFGMRPLYFTILNENLVFASEMKAMANHPSVLKKINPYSLNFFFSYFYVPTEDTLIYGVKKILPATCKMFSFEKKPTLLSSARYWQLNLNPTIKTHTSVLCEEIYGAMLDSVKEKIKDNPSLVGVSLSGGLDSGLLSTLLRKLDKEVVAFVITMEGGEQNEARATAEFNGSKVEEIFITSEDYIKNVDEVVKILDEPIFEWAVIPLYLIGQRARKKVDMLFTGDGGDETFWGYPSAPRRWFDPFLSVIPSTIKGLVNILLNSKGISGKREKPLFRGLSLETIYEKTSLPASNQFFLDVLKKCNPNDLQNTDQVPTLKTLAGPIDACFKKVPVNDDLLRRYYALLTINLVHGAAGIRSRENIYNYHGIKCAMPFMDERVIRLGYSIPSDLKQPTRHQTKYIMRKMIARYKLLPERIIEVRKHALGDPLDTWRRSKMLREFMLDKLDEGHRLGIIKKDFINKVRSGTITPGRCFGIMMYILWYEDFFRMH